MEEDVDTRRLEKNNGVMTLTTAYQWRINVYTSAQTFFSHCDTRWKCVVRYHSSVISLWGLDILSEVISANLSENIQILRFLITFGGYLFNDNT